MVTTQASNQDSYIVLVSGGLDSVVNLHWAQKEGKVVQAITFDYGQRAAAQEVKAAQYFCQKLGVNHLVVELPWLKALTNTALVDRSKALPQVRDLNDFSETSESARSVWVPNRNGIFLNIAAAFAEARNVPFVVPGFNREEATTFPDNSIGFLNAATHAFSLSTMNKVQAVCFTSSMDKVAMIKKAREFNIELDRLWSCYEAGPKRCGQCESCLRSERALKESAGAV